MQFTSTYALSAVAWSGVIFFVHPLSIAFKASRLLVPDTATCLKEQVEPYVHVTPAHTPEDSARYETQMCLVAPVPTASGAGLREVAVGVGAATAGTPLRITVAPCSTRFPAALERRRLRLLLKRQPALASRT